MQWLQDKQHLTHENVQNICTDITLHMMHILRQYTKGIITGTNTKRWKDHILANSRLHLFPFY